MRDRLVETFDGGVVFIGNNGASLHIHGGMRDEYGLSIGFDRSRASISMLVGSVRRIDERINPYHHRSDSSALFVFIASFVRTCRVPVPRM